LRPILVSATDPNLLPETALTVAGLTDYVKLLLESDWELQQVWVVGEVSSASDRPSGTFFTLREPDGSASIRCTIWSSQRDRLACQPAVGEQVFVLGGLRLYRKRGEYQLSVWQAFPAGAGLEAMRRRQLRDRLAAEGLFDPKRKRPLPSHPRCLAVVTSPAAAAWGDIQRTLRQRFPGLTVLLSPAVVQGERAPSSIARAVARVAADGRAEVLVLARGGGASEDLACFDDEGVVRAIATSPIPVLTGIGHERDESLADLAADRCAHTPTAAAELAVPDLTSLRARHHKLALDLASSVRRCYERERQDLDRLATQLRQLPRNRTWERSRQHCQLLREKLNALDPRAVLQRGYATVSRDAAIVRSAAEVAPRDELTVRLGRGRLVVRVQAIDERGDE